MSSVLFLSSPYRETSENTRTMAQWVLKVYQAQKSVHVFIEDPKLIDEFDQAMWEVSQGQFVAFDTQWHEKLPIYIGPMPNSAYHPDLILNLSQQIVKTQSNAQVIEWIANNDSEKQIQRERYRQYQTDGWEVMHEKQS